MQGFSFGYVLFFIASAFGIAAGLRLGVDLSWWASIALAVLGGVGVVALLVRIDAHLVHRALAGGSDDEAEAEGLGGAEVSARRSKGPRLELPRLPRELSCPACASRDIAVFLYGQPAITAELLEAVAAKKVTLGGCMPHEQAPRWACNACGKTFGGSG